MTPDTLGPYRILSELGRGGMGSVHLAEDEAGARVALKVIHPHLVQDAEAYQTLFRREAELGMRVDHPNVVRTLDVGMDPDFLAMEFVEGQTFRGLKEELGLVPEELCLHLGQQVAEGLAAIHEAGAVHRDIKPENLIVTPDHRVKIMDLGLAHLADASFRLSQTVGFAGTALYAAPEQFAGEDPAPAADWFALGLVLYELATGRVPGASDSLTALLKARTAEHARPAGELNPQLSPFFEAVLGDLLALEAARRLTFLPEAGSAWWVARAAEIQRASKAPLRRIRIPREAALHGRGDELAVLDARLQQAIAGEGQVLLVEGEAGIGKSRLVDEFAARTDEEIHYLFGSYPPGGAGSMLAAFREAFAAQLGESSADRYLGDLAAMAPAVDALLRGLPTPEGVQPLRPEGQQAAFTALVRGLAEERPVLLLIDDLHFAPEEGRALFATLAQAAPSTRLLLVGTARPSVDAAWMDAIGGLPHTTRMPLARLGAKEIGRLLEDALGSPHLAEELGYQILTKSDGNPFFVFEILRDLRDGRYLTQTEEGAWTAIGALDEIAIPSSIAELVEARLRKLSEEERDLVDLAACVGFDFDPLLVVESLGEARAPVLKRLAVLERKHGLVRSVGRRYVFDHHQVQEFAYQGIPELLREDYHRQLGEALERRSTEQPTPEQAVALSEHWLRSDEPTHARPFLLAASQHLSGQYEHGRQARMLTLALERAELVDEARLEVLLELAECQLYFGRREERDVALQEAKALADQLDAPVLAAKTYLALGNYHQAADEIEEAIDMAGKAVEFAGQGLAIDVLDEALIEIATYLGMVARHAEGLAMLESVTGKTPTLQAQLAMIRGRLQSYLGEFDDAERNLREAAEGMAALGLRAQEGNARQLLATVYMYLGRMPDALVAMEGALEAIRQVGFKRGEGILLGNLGVMYEGEGQLERARELMSRHIAISKEVGYDRGEQTGQLNLGRVHLWLGDYEKARELLDASLDHPDTAAARGPRGYAYFDRGDWFRFQGRYEEAAQDFEASLAIRREIEDRGRMPVTLLRLGECRAALGDREAAEACWEECESFEDEEMPPLLALARGDLDTARELHDSVGSTFPFLACLEIRTRLGLPEALEDVQTLLDHAPADRHTAMLERVPLLREAAALDPARRSTWLGETRVWSKDD